MIVMHAGPGRPGASFIMEFIRDVKPYTFKKMVDALKSHLWLKLLNSTGALMSGS
jgi:hypothetical protein